jgi:hypothetical protein
LTSHYILTGELAELEFGINAHEEAVRLARSLARDWTGATEGLAFALQLRYRRTGRVIDLERAINLLERAERLTPLKSFHRASLLDSLGVALGERHRYTDDPSDLQRSIELHREVLHITEQSPVFALARMATLSRLSDALIARYSKIGDAEDLAAAVAAAEESLVH